ncbi:SdpA family antimicrobial peptide system protein [Micromonospora cathayae]|uniref:SdpA family antimicrobial peptide system protein n=1 Tax=Micromonospora cathayae TaxID=3028804 RepID=A0ABY7ZVY7_9ACTN|nr:SdpA family antimicrobial peptide system protein [Micromonospora sp. HUAS 3]WDZ86561.1 SdpA family antimicrobial peptide system protein [Micromonospora sp. HUAS 3]
MADNRNRVVVPRRPVLWIGLLVALVALFDLQTFLPGNAVSLPGQRQAAPVLRALLPQGWAFFTKSPRSPDLVVHAVRPDGQLDDVTTGSYAEPRYAFGLDRSARAQATELALLVSGLPGSAWRSCRQPTEACLAEAVPTPAAPVRNSDDTPSLCGPVVLARTEPVPWAYRDLVAGEVRFTHVVRLEVSC